MKRNLIIVILGITLLIGGFVFLAPKQVDTSPQTEYATIVVKDDQRLSGPASISVRQGDTVVLKITTDQSDELHLHGYDEKIDLEANVATSLTFTANLTGEFEYELEKSKLVLGQLQVHPR